MTSIKMVNYAHQQIKRQTIVSLSLFFSFVRPSVTTYPHIFLSIDFYTNIRSRLLFFFSLTNDRMTNIKLKARVLF
jgi:hypothetical protein